MPKDNPIIIKRSVPRPKPDAMLAFLVDNTLPKEEGILLSIMPLQGKTLDQVIAEFQQTVGSIPDVEYNVIFAYDWQDGCFSLVAVDHDNYTLSECES